MQTPHAHDSSHAGLRSAHLRDYWKVIWRGRYTALAIFLLIAGLAVLRSALATPIYEAKAVLEIKPEAKRILPGQEQWVGAEGGGWLGEEKYFNTQLEVLRSLDVADRAFRQLQLERHPMFASSSDPIAAFARMVQIRPKVNTRLVTVSMRGANPKEAQEWVNTVVDVYVQRNVDEATASFRAIMDEISRGMVDFRASLGQANVERLQTAADKNLYVPEDEQEILRQSLQTYNDALSKLRVEIGSLGSEIAGLERVRGQRGDLMTLPRFAQDVTVQDLLSQKFTLERELERIAAEKRPSHPDYISRSAELQKIQQKIDGQLERIVEKLRTQHALALQQAAYLEGQKRNTERQAYQVRQASSSYELQKTEAESRRKVYDLVSETMQRLSMGAQLISMNNNVSVLDRATEPRHPVAPRKMVSLGIGCVLGLLFGVGTVLFLDYLDNTVRTPEDVEQYLGLAMLAVVPKYREDSNAAREAYQSLRTSILFSSHNREKRILLFTSAGPQEGKSSTVASLGRAMASVGDRVIIIDCDLRRPTQHVHLGVSREPGLTSYLLDGADQIEPFVHHTDVPTLDVFTCGPIPPNPPELIGVEKFRDLLLELKRRYDWVIIDSPPVASLADSVVLSSLAEMMALVIKHNENDRDLIRRSLKRLRDVNANVIGAVLNSVDLDRSSDYYATGYYYYATQDDPNVRRRRGGGSLRGPRTGGGSASRKVAL